MRIGDHISLKYKLITLVVIAITLAVGFTVLRGYAYYKVYFENFKANYIEQRLEERRREFGIQLL